jgi:hypothetical protein
VVVLLQTLATGCGRDQPGCTQWSGAFSCTEAPRQSRERRKIAGRRGKVSCNVRHACAPGEVPRPASPQGRIRRRVLTDRFGRKKLFMITLGIYLVATALTALSSQHELQAQRPYPSSVTSRRVTRDA